MHASPTRKSVYKTFIRPILFIIGLTFFGFLVVQNWHETQILLKTIHWSLFLFSVLVAMFDNVLLSVLFQQLLTKYDLHFEYSQIGRMFFYGQIAKYIPGRLWNVLYHATFSQRLGATSAMLFANLDMMMLGIIRTFTIAIFLILVFHQVWIAGGLLFLGILLFWYFSKSCWIAGFFQFLTHRIKRLARHVTPYHAGYYHTGIIFLYGTIWVTFLIANFSLMKALGISLEESALYIAYFGLAWIVGVVSFIMPAGIGMREIVFVFLAGYLGQNSTTDIATLIAIAIIYRFWQVCLDIGGLGIGFILRNEN